MHYIYPMKYDYTFIVPVFNRPNEVEELLFSLCQQTVDFAFEVTLIEDGSTQTAEEVVERFSSKLNINYLTKPNTGPGDSRNFGMSQANGNFFIILDSDVILPPDYLSNVHNFLTNSHIQCFGGPDIAHASFSNLQKAIDYCMTSFFTTGGIRGHKKNIQNYEPRSFNMGISKNLFLKTKGFTNIHPGEDPDLSIRIQQLGYATVFLPKAGVFHKRRITWSNFFQQVYKFGLVRPILFKKHPKTIRLSYFFPSLFTVSLLFSILLVFFNFSVLSFVFIVYFVLLFIDSFRRYFSFQISFYVLIASCIQFFGYGLGFMKSIFFIHICNKKPTVVFPYLFYKGKNQF